MQVNGKHKSSFPSHPGRRGAVHNSRGRRRHPLSDEGVRIRLPPITSVCLVLVADGATSAHLTVRPSCPSPGKERRATPHLLPLLLDAVVAMG
jgi:hypothetical protein